MTDSNSTLAYASDHELLQMVTAALMTRFYFLGCPGIARAVVQHLEVLLQHPEVCASEVAEQGYRALREQWLEILRQRAPRRAGPSQLMESERSATASLH